MEKTWKIKSVPDIEKIQHLSNVLNVDASIAKILAQRSIYTFDEAKEFFRPSLDMLHDPFLMKDMKKAVERLNQAIEKKEKILVYGDYDVDGTTSVAMVYSFLTKKILSGRDSQLVSYYVPDRYTEGYGISYKSIDFASEQGFSLVIALDCGIKAVEKMKYAREKSIDYIICDHHLPGDEVPCTAAVLDPKRHDCSYPFKNLSGCGVGFKLLQAFAISNNMNLEHVYEYLDLVAVSIASDIVPITGENRILEFYGLKKLNQNPSNGLKSIIKTAGIEDKNILVSDIVFKIGPRINAAGRIKSARTAVDLLIEETNMLAGELSEEINSFNNDRKDIDKRITEEALSMIMTNEELADRYSTVLFNEHWHKGVIGIVASRLIESYYRPTIVLTRSNGFATGSARSIEDFNLYNAIDACSDLLENYGGHSHAAGVTLKLENIEKFRNRFEDYVRNNVTPEMMVPKIDIDAEIALEDINEKLYRILAQFEPYGPDNMKPVFCTRAVIDNGSAKLVGESKDHIKLTVSNKGKKKFFSSIVFSRPDLYETICRSNSFDICYTVEENVYQGRKSLQLNIRDIKPGKE